MGVSIGLESSEKDTATLGGYIEIDGIPHILTVHHLFTDEESGDSVQTWDSHHPAISPRSEGAG